MSPRFRLRVLHVCVRPLLAHSPWNRVLTPLVNFAHMSLWIPSSVPLPRVHKVSGILSLHLCPQPCPAPCGLHSALALPVCAVMQVPWLPWSAPTLMSPVCVVSHLCKHHHPCVTGTKQCVLCPAHQDMFSQLAFCSPPSSRRPGRRCC